ncbi:MAG: SDR family oxidoreductase [Myxococcota bacterium]
MTSPSTPLHHLAMPDRVAIVTGGCRGIGRTITTCLLDAGAHVIICCRRPPETLPTGSDGREAIFVAADIRDPDQIDTVVAKARDQFGRLDTLINNAGGSPWADTASASPRFTEKIIALNLTAPLVFSQRAADLMRTNTQGGTIINIASVSGIRPSPGTAAYGAAKAGLINLTRTLAVEWAPQIRVNAIVAGMIRTAIAHQVYGDDEAIARIEATVPMRRLGLPSDVGHLCLFLASDLSSYINGAAIPLDGGGERPAFLDAAKGDG